MMWFGNAASPWSQSPSPDSQWIEHMELYSLLGVKYLAFISVLTDYWMTKNLVIDFCEASAGILFLLSFQKVRGWNWNFYFLLHTTEWLHFLIHGGQHKRDGRNKIFIRIICCECCRATGNMEEETVWQLKCNKT